MQYSEGMRHTAIIATLLAFCFATTVAYGHHGPATTTINAAAKKQPGAPFSHGKHGSTYVKTCETCHHLDKGLTKETDKNVKKCSACHLDPKDNAPSMREMSLTKNPMHTLCVGCHKEQKKGPTACTGCHKK